MGVVWLGVVVDLDVECGAELEAGFAVGGGFDADEAEGGGVGGVGGGHGAVVDAVDGEGAAQGAVPVFGAGEAVGVDPAGGVVVFGGSFPFVPFVSEVEGAEVGDGCGLDDELGEDEADEGEELDAVVGDEEEECEEGDYGGREPGGGGFSGYEAAEVLVVVDVCELEGEVWSGGESVEAVSESHGLGEGHACGEEVEAVEFVEGVFVEGDDLVLGGGCCESLVEGVEVVLIVLVLFGGERYGFWGVAVDAACLGGDLDHG